MVIIFSKYLKFLWHVCLLILRTLAVICLTMYSSQLDCMVIFLIRTKCFFVVFSFQGRHVKTGQLAAIKVMDVTGVKYLFLAISIFIIEKLGVERFFFP